MTVFLVIAVVLTVSDFTRLKRGSKSEIFAYLTFLTLAVTGAGSYFNYYG